MRVGIQVLRVLEVSKVLLVLPENLERGAVQVLMEEEGCQEKLGLREIEGLMDFQVCRETKVIGGKEVLRVFLAFRVMTERGEKMERSGPGVFQVKLVQEAY